MARDIPPQNEPAPAMMGGSGNYSYVDAKELKQVNVPLEATLGALNGSVSGGILSVAGSVLVTALTKDKNTEETLGKLVMQNIKTTHYLPIIVATAAFATLGAVVRFTRASSHNDWSDRQYALQQQQAKGFTQREEEKATSAKEPAR